MTSQKAGPGEPPKGHWAFGVYHQLRVHLQAQRGLAAYTVRNYLTDLAPFWRFLDGQGVRDLGAVNRTLVRAYLYWLLTEGATHPRARGEGLGTTGAARSAGSGYAQRSVVRKLSALRTLFRFLARTGELPADPTARLASAKTGQRLPDFLDRRGVEALLAAPRESTPTGMRDRAILELLYAAGLRVSEVTGLDVEDVDLERGEVRVLGKGSRQRVGLLGAPARRALERYLQVARPLAQGGRARRDAAAFFLNRNGGRLTPRSVQLLVRRYSRQAGLASGVHPHTLRHTFATHLLDGGADLRVVQELLGHATPTTTQIYTHVTQASARQAYQAAHPRAQKLAGKG